MNFCKKALNLITGHQVWKLLERSCGRSSREVTMLGCTPVPPVSFPPHGARPIAAIRHAGQPLSKRVLRAVPPAAWPQAATAAGLLWQPLRRVAQGLCHRDPAGQASPAPAKVGTGRRGEARQGKARRGWGPHTRTHRSSPAPAAGCSFSLKN